MQIPLENVQEIILENNIDGFFDLICSEVYKQMRDHSENKIPIEIIMFNFDGNVFGALSQTVRDFIKLAYNQRMEKNSNFSHY